MNTRTTVVLAALLLLANANAKVLLADEDTKQDILFQPIAFGVPTLDSQPLHIGSRRELFVDNVIIGELRGGAIRKLFEMTPATTEANDVAMTHDLMRSSKQKKGFSKSRNISSLVCAQVRRASTSTLC